ncbi:glutathione transferase GstA [Hydrocarboniphaga sp.]|uniref:glutathione transferase GstA n=1 Tax=Hydrocarboniphaga sp. TaxID=2033016 RepID=UPI003D14E945
MKLYYAQGACSLAPHITAEECGLKLDIVKVDLRVKQTEAGVDYNSVNAKGYVPALQMDDGSLLTETQVIVQYLADLRPEAGLAPKAGSVERYRLQEWLAYIAGEIHKNVGGLFRAAPDGREALIANANRRLEFAASALRQQPWLMGEAFSVADIYLYVVLSWAPMLKFDLSPFPALQDFFARVAARPAVQQARRDEGLPA